MLSGVVGLLVVVGFTSTFISDGSNNNGAGMLLGCLTAFVCVAQFLPLLLAVAVRRISPWWAAAHAVLFTASLVLIACAAMFETGSADR
ncbi:hypothetical protein [Nonomuraea sp. B19D2]|uniref:hypothetical protein n=1 Tax=Nonomuraea sp. B19D2 TaxID=3159561 RepID=UPI0032DBC621